jgi:hypothetical protein
LDLATFGTPEVDKQSEEPYIDDRFPVSEPVLKISAGEPYV